jgi:hypothetical protein
LRLGRVQVAVIDRVDFAHPVGGARCELHDAHARVARDGSLQRGERIVGAAVEDEHDLEVRVVLLQ